MTQKPARITEKVSVSLHLVLLIITFTVWLARMGEQVKINSEAIKELKAKVARHCQLLSRKAEHDDDE
jgi:hypothetical protein